MSGFSANHYERAFGGWLIDNSVQYIAVDEAKRAAFGHLKFKSFDFLVYPPGQCTMIVEVKGRKFKGTSFAGLRGFDCWVTAEDVAGLTRWQQLLGSGHRAAFVFAYKVENIDVDFDGREVYQFEANKYIFFAVLLDDYRRSMKLRSPKWGTLTLPAEKFRRYAVQMQNLVG
jgi:hypothetical protein